MSAKSINVKKENRESILAYLVLHSDKKDS